MELFKLLGTIAIDNQDANDGIDQTTGKASAAQEKITAAFKKIGTAVVTFFAVDKIKDFGLACINASADANAMESQFSQVFGDMEEQASASLSKMASEAGITENRMKGSYTKIAAFAKTTGMETADALSLADRAMVAVADSAAFYDRSLEETTESLQSFLKGNFENDAALGLSCTETTRNAAANKLYGKSFIELSESQKQLTLLKMVEDANELSGALGQASRESDTWTNQVGNLKQAWTDFKSEIGGYFLEAAVNGVKKASDAVQWLSDTFVNLHDYMVDTVFIGFEKLTGGLSYLGASFQPLIDSVKGMVASFLGVEEPGDLMRTIVYAIEEALTNLSVKLYDMGLWIRTHMPEIQAIVTGLWEAVQLVWDTIGQPIFDALLAIFQVVYDTFMEKLPEIQAFVAQCFADIQVLWEEHLKPCLEAIGNFIKTILAPVFQAVFEGTIGPLVDTVFKGIKDLWENTLKPVFTGITDFLTGVFTLNWTQAWEGLSSILKGIINGIINGIETMVNSAINAINGLIEGINELISKAGDLLGLDFVIPTIPRLTLPRLERGGILEKGQMGFLEGNGAEAVVPLDQNRKWISAVAEDMNSAIGGGRQVQELKEAFSAFVDALPDMLIDAFATMKFDVNNREFARLVKAVN